MKEYNVIITPDAEEELNGIYDYIATELLAPGIAYRYICDIRDQLTTLSYAPKRYQIVYDEPWKSIGVRRMNVHSFAVFYVILEEYNEVYIQNIIYQKRDLPKILHELYHDL